MWVISQNHNEWDHEQVSESSELHFMRYKNIIHHCLQFVILDSWWFHRKEQCDFQKIICHYHWSCHRFFRNDDFWYNHFLDVLWNWLTAQSWWQYRQTVSLHLHEVCWECWYHLKMLNLIIWIEHQKQNEFFLTYKIFWDKIIEYTERLEQDKNSIYL